MLDRDANIPVSDQRPVVIIGMHRSGTSLLARALEQCGVYMGADVENNHESQLFMSINDALLLRCYSTWNNPFAIYLALQTPQTVDHLAQFAISTLRSNSRQYLPDGAPGGGVNILDSDMSWGWKDPRNTFTLPVWSRIFPHCRVVHILRHGVDAADSLVRRDWPRVDRDDAACIPALALLQDKAGLHHARRGWTLEQAFTLWEEYVERAVQLVEQLGDNALQLRYEDLLQHPQANLEKLVRFCGRDPGALTAEIIDAFDAQRAFAYQRDPQLCEFAARWQKTLARFGY